MALVGWKCVKDGSDKSFGDCIQCAMTDEHCEFTPEMLAYMARDSRRRKSIERISVTTLTKDCLRQIVIQDRYDYRMTPRRAFFLLRGNLMHAVLEGALTSDGWQEVTQRRTIELPDGRKIVVEGRVDKLVIDKGLIRDYKTSIRLPSNTMTNQNHALQLNIYRWIWYPIFHATRLRLQYIDMAGTKQVKVDIMPIEEVEELIRRKAFDYVKALESESIPEDEYNKSQWWCRYCDVPDICKAINEEAKVNGKTTKRAKRTN